MLVCTIASNSTLRIGFWRNLLGLKKLVTFERGYQLIWNYKRGLLIRSIAKGFLLLCLVTSCVSNSCRFEPAICYYPNEHLLETLSSSFAPLTDEEIQTEWGKEYFVGLQFAKEFDLYRAITSFKRSLFFIPLDNKRCFEIEFCIVEAYYLGKKYAEALNTFELGRLGEIPLEFPALRELLLMLYESYIAEGQIEKAIRILGLLDEKQRSQLELNYALQTADFAMLSAKAESDEKLSNFLSSYCDCTLSPQKARFLNAVFPGAGYAYVGQKKTALTSFLINALFITAAYQFFDRGYAALGLITASIETGWYFGGINGAGIAAAEHNEYVYEIQAKDFMIRQKLFPILMFEYAF